MSTIVFIGVDPEYKQVVADAFPTATVVEPVLNGQDLIDACADAEIVSFSHYSAFSRDIIEKLPKLRLLCTRSVGYNLIDLDACADAGVTVCNVPDYGSHVIAEHVFALLLSTLRHVHEAEERVHGGNFAYTGLKGMALKDKTMGIVGTGKIGRHAAQIALGFGMQVIAVDQCRNLELEKQGVEYKDREELFARSDVISLHIPALESTKGLLNDETFAQMKDDVIIVNTARGALIEKQALLSALDSGKVRYALLDVLEPEKDYEKNKDLINHPKVVVTPHIAFYADESMGNMFELSFKSIREWQAGETPRFIIKPEPIVCDRPGV